MNNVIRFSNEDAKRVINEMRLCYGKKFSDQWVGIDPKDLAQKMVDLFFDLTEADLIRGFAKMQTHAFAPTLPEFKSWCVGDLKSQWLGVNEAWSIARGSIDFNGYELTVVWTKECAVAFDAVVGMVKLGDKYQIAEAKKVFSERYERMVLESLGRGEKPCYVISYGDDKQQRITALKEAEIAGLIESEIGNNLIKEIQAPKMAQKESERFKELAKEHLEKLGKLIKRNPEKPIDEVEKNELGLFDLSKNLPEWVDPFDDADLYKKTLKKEGKPVPMMLRE